MISTRRCPAPTGTAPSSPRGAAAAGAVAVLTDPAGPRRGARRRAAGAGRRRPAGGARRGRRGDLRRPDRRGSPMIGITGTAGKTSTAYLVESGLRAAGLTTGLIGTVETRLGDLVVDSVRTTPEATDLHAMLAAAARARGHRGGDGGVQPRAGDGPGRRGARSRSAATPTSASTTSTSTPTSTTTSRPRPGSSTAGAAAEVLNLDDPALRPLFKPATISYSAAGDRGRDLVGRPTIRPAAFGQRFIAHGPGGVAVAGRASRCPAGTTWRTRCSPWPRWSRSGWTPQVAARGIAACPGVPGRLERVDAPGDVLGVVDYAHKPDAIVAALAALRELATGPRRPADLRDRRRRRPGPGQAPADGRGRRPRRRPGDRHRRQPAHRGPGRGPGRGARRAPSRPARAAKIIEVAGPAGRDRRGGPAGRPGDVVAVLGKGHERGPGGGRRGAAVRRPDRAGRGADRAPRGAPHDPDDAGRDRRGHRRPPRQRRPGR